MNEIQAFLLGLVQGLTEYLPVSSSGHLEIGKMLLDVDPKQGGLVFDIAVHVATVMSTLVILRKEILWILKGMLRLEWNEETRYALNIIISMIPIGIVGLVFKDDVESLYADAHIRHIVVGVCLIITSCLLALTHFYKPQEESNISPTHSFIIGIAQACAVLPGLSRSGSTIATGLLLGNKKESLAKFSFLMVIPPILGEALLDAKDMIGASADAASIPTTSLLVGFIAAFISGCFACKWMISLVKRCKLIYFAAYCAAAGILVLILG